MAQLYFLKSCAEIGKVCDLGVIAETRNLMSTSFVQIQFHSDEKVSLSDLST